MPPRYIWTDERDKIMLQAWLRTTNSLPRNCNGIAQLLGPHVSAAMVKSRLEYLAQPSDHDADATDDQRSIRNAVPAVRHQTGSKQPVQRKRKRPVVHSSSDEGNGSATESEHPYSSGNDDGSSSSFQGSSRNILRAAAGQHHGAQAVVRQGPKSNPNPNLRKTRLDISFSGSGLSSSGNEERDAEAARHQPQISQGLHASKQPVGQSEARSSNVLTPKTARVSNTTPSRAGAVTNSNNATKSTTTITSSNAPDTAGPRAPPPIPGPSIPIVQTSSTTKLLSRLFDLTKGYQIYTYIPATMIPYVIGKNGSNIKTVEQKTEARVSVIDNTPPTSANERIVMIRGTVEQCRRAENAIRVLAMGHNLGTALKAKTVIHGSLVFDGSEEELEEDVRVFAARHRLL